MNTHILFAELLCFAKDCRQQFPIARVGVQLAQIGKQTLKKRFYAHPPLNAQMKKHSSYQPGASVNEALFVSVSEPSG